MRPPTAPRQAGFTLIELLIGLAIFLVILLAIYQVLDTNRTTYLSGARKVDVQQNARAAVDELARQLRMTGYFPENFATPPATPPLANPLQVATTTALAVYGDLDGSGASSVFLYCLNGTSLLRKKGAVGAAPSYTCSTGDLLAENITGLRFTYYDATPTPVPDPPAGAYTLDNEGLNAVPPFASTAQRGGVRTIVITLTALEGVPVPGQAAQSYTLTASVRLRNLN
jgi:prepilin-type N-terminal cleavage/methylation domain-containing protein